LLPHDVFISVEQRTPGNFDPADWEILRRVVDLIKVNAPGGELGPKLELIETALRSERAQLIEAERVGSPKVCGSTPPPYRPLGFGAHDGQPGLTADCPRSSTMNTVIELRPSQSEKPTVAGVGKEH
jgi:hypothetical protein